MKDRESLEWSTGAPLGSDSKSPPLPAAREANPRRSRSAGTSLCAPEHFSAWSESEAQGGEPSERCLGHIWRVEARGTKGGFNRLTRCLLASGAIPWALACRFSRTSIVKVSTFQAGLQKCHTASLTPDPPWWPIGRQAPGPAKSKRHARMTVLASPFLEQLSDEPGEVGWRHKINI